MSTLQVIVKAVNRQLDVAPCQYLPGLYVRRVLIRTVEPFPANVRRFSFFRRQAHQSRLSLSWFGFSTVTPLRATGVIPNCLASTLYMRLYRVYATEYGLT